MPTNAEHVVSEFTLEIRRRIIYLVVWAIGPWRRLTEARVYALRHKSRNSLFVDRIVRSDSGQVIIDAMTKRVFSVLFCKHFENCSLRSTHFCWAFIERANISELFPKRENSQKNLKVNRKKKWIMWWKMKYVSTRKFIIINCIHVISQLFSFEIVPVTRDVNHNHWSVWRQFAVAYSFYCSSIPQAHLCSQ